MLNENSLVLQINKALPPSLSTKEVISLHKYITKSPSHKKTKMTSLNQHSLPKHISSPTSTISVQSTPNIKTYISI